MHIHDAGRQWFHGPEGSGGQTGTGQGQAKHPSFATGSGTFWRINNHGPTVPEIGTDRELIKLGAVSKKSFLDVING
jgi:hypothetical protein